MYLHPFGGAEPHNAAAAAVDDDADDDDDGKTFNWMQVWANTHPMNSDDLLLKQAEMLLAADPGVPGYAPRVWVYRNTIKALNWYTSVRGEKTVFLSHLYIKTMILPRQARDKHRENSKKSAVFSPEKLDDPKYGKKTALFAPFIY